MSRRFPRSKRPPRSHSRRSPGSPASSCLAWSATDQIERVNSSAVLEVSSIEDAISDAPAATCPRARPTVITVSETLPIRAPTACASLASRPISTRPIFFDRRRHLLDRRGVGKLSADGHLPYGCRSLGRRRHELLAGGGEIFRVRGDALFTRPREFLERGRPCRPTPRRGERRPSSPRRSTR